MTVGSKTNICFPFLSLQRKSSGPTSLGEPRDRVVRGTGRLRRSSPASRVWTPVEACRGASPRRVDPGRARGSAPTPGQTRPAGENTGTRAGPCAVPAPDSAAGPAVTRAPRGGARIPHLTRANQFGKGGLSAGHLATFRTKSVRA